MAYQYNDHTNTGRKRFEAHEVARIPVEVSAAAHALIVHSSTQGRLLPQAIAEGFATLPGIERVRLDAVPKAQHFPVTIMDYHHTRDREPMLLVIMAQHCCDAARSYTWHINAHDLEQVHAHAGGMGAFEARTLVSELLRSYRAL